VTARSVEAWEIAAESLGLPTGPRVRPNPLQWIWYAFWGPLPRRYAIWVLYDTTCSTWVLRYFARIFTALAAPVTAIALFLPGGADARAWTSVMAGAGALLFTSVWINESTEHRLVRAGFDWGLASPLRSKRNEMASRLRHW
jgi:hypothetical protein